MYLITINIHPHNHNSKIIVWLLDKIYFPYNYVIKNQSQFILKF